MNAKKTKQVEFDPLNGLPGSVVTEREVIGSVLSGDEQAFRFVRDSLSPHDFEIHAHRTIFKRLLELAEEGMPTDRSAVAQRLIDHRELESIGGISYLIGELDIPPGLSLDGRILKVKHDSLRRRFIRQANAAMVRVAEVGDSEQAFADLHHEIEGLMSEWSGDAGFVTPLDVIAQAGGIEAYLRRDYRDGIKTKWGGLNALIGGLKPGHLFVVAAHSSRGKTAFALNVAGHAATRGTGVAIFSQEMEADELTDRFLSGITGLTWKVIRHGCNESDVRFRVLQAANSLSQIHIDARDTTTVPAMCARLRKLRTKESIGLVIVDYLQLVSGAGRFSSRENEVASISRGLKHMAKEFHLPVIALSQLNRDSSKNDREPELHDLRESGTIGNDANEVLFLHVTSMWDDNNPMGCVSALLKKHRNGPTGTVLLQFHAPTGVFMEIDTESGE